MPDFVLVQAKSFLQISLKSGLNTEFLQFSVAKKATKTSVFRRKNKQKWGILWVQLSSVPPIKNGSFFISYRSFFLVILYEKYFTITFAISATLNLIHFLRLTGCNRDLVGLLYFEKDPLRLIP